MHDVVSDWLRVLICEVDGTHPSIFLHFPRFMCDVVSVPWSPPQPLPLQPQTRLQWRRCADLPVEMTGAQAVLVGGKVCVGGGDTEDAYSYLLFQYDRGRDGWATLPPCPVRLFGLGQFNGHIITVGGRTHGGDTTNKLHHYKEESQTWEEYLRPMPTQRRRLSVLTTQSAIIACGGVDSKGQVCVTVEVYTDEPSRWYTADPLPIRCYWMTSVIVNDTCYLLGGCDEYLDPTKSVLQCASITSLVERAKSPPKYFAALFASVWRTVKNTPLYSSTAASLSGSLLAVGGQYDRLQKSPAVHMFQPQTNSWVRMTSGDLPKAVHAVTAIQLPDNELFLCGGYSGRSRSQDVFIGSITDS